MKNTLCKRLALLFLVLNSVAFMVNCCGISPHFDFYKDHKSFEFFVLTDTSSELPASDKVGQNVQELDGFWPFEDFYVETPKSNNITQARFRGLFAGYHAGEFLFYSLLIAMVFVFFKLW